MAGRPRKPISILKIQGTAQKCRTEKRRGELELDNNLPGPPDYLPEAARDEWRYLLSESKYARALNRVDIGMLEIWSVLRAEWKADVLAGVKTESSRIAVMKQIGASLGLTPTDRTKMQVSPEERPRNKFLA